jgi:hypothetical protein
MDIYTFLVLLHVVGTILGAGGAMVAELQIARALKDKRLSMDERALMHANYSMIRVGMATILVSVLGMFWYFEAQGGANPMFTEPKLLIKELMFAVIFINAVPLWLGASLSFTSWWGATLLGLAGDLSYSFTTFLVGYLLAIFAIAGLFHLLRMWSWMGYLNGRTTILSFALVFFLVAATVFYLIHGEQFRNEVAEPEAATSAYYETLTETVSFAYPGGSHTVVFTLGLDEVGHIQNVTAVDVDPENQGRIAEFATNVTELVAGQTLEELTPLSRVGGASLTTEAFNEAVTTLQADGLGGS